MFTNQVFYEEDTGTNAGSYSSRRAHEVPDGRFKVEAERLGAVQQSVRISELNDYFKIEVPAVGFKREQFHISIQDQVLTVCCTRGHDCSESKMKPRKRKIILPENADIDFATAEYREGVLNIFVFKTSQPNHHRRVEVSVY